MIIVEITDNDIAKYDFPIPDNLLAKLLETIATAKPVAIGLDIYRDVAVPRDGSHLAELNRVFQQNQNIIGIFKFGDHEHPVKVSFPPVIAGNPERYGFNDFPFELGAVRRGFLFLWDNQDHVYTSFALALALKAGVDLQQEGSNVRIGKAMFFRFRSNDGGYIRAQDGGHQFLLDFKSPRKFVTYSLDDVLSNRVNEEAWRGKVVLIGEGAESAHDFETNFITLAAETNESMPFYVRDMVIHEVAHLPKSITDVKVLVLGVAFKRDVDDTRPVQPEHHPADPDAPPVRADPEPRRPPTDPT